MSEFCLLFLLFPPLEARVSQLKGNKPCLYTGPIIDHNLGHPSLSKPALSPFLSFSSSPSSSLSFSLSFIAEPGDDNGLRGGVSFLEVSKSFATLSLLFLFLPFSFLFPLRPLSFSFHFIFTWTKSGWFFTINFTILYFLYFNFSFDFQLKFEILYWSL